MHIISKIILVCVVIIVLYANTELPFVIVSPSRNNSTYCAEYFASVFGQKYHNYRVIYIDDCSTDNTLALARESIKLYKQEDRVTLVANKTRLGAMANHYRAVHACKPYEIIVNLDGDDKFAHNQVLQYLNFIYTNQDIWLTYGQYIIYPKCNIISNAQKIPEYIIEKNAYRSYPFVSQHLRSFYAGLFQKIKLSDFLYRNKFIPAACDMAFMIPMLEMARKHARFIDKILYVYNIETPFNDYKINALELDAMAQYIRTKQKYNKLDSRQDFLQNNKPKHADYIIYATNKNKLITLLESIQKFSRGHDKIIVIGTSDVLKSAACLATKYICFISDEQAIYKALRVITSEYVLLMDTNVAFVKNINIPDAIYKLESTQAHAYYVGLSGKKYKNSLIDIGDNTYAWQAGWFPDLSARYNSAVLLRATNLDKARKIYQNFCDIIICPKKTVVAEQ